MHKATECGHCFDRVSVSVPAEECEPLGAQPKLAVGHQRHSLNRRLGISSPAEPCWCVISDSSQAKRGRSGSATGSCLSVAKPRDCSESQRHFSDCLAATPKAALKLSKNLQKFDSTRLAGTHLAASAAQNQRLLGQTSLTWLVGRQTGGCRLNA